VIIETLEVGPLLSNCYVIGCEETLRGAVVDPGAEPARILACVKGRGLEIGWILDTHAHADHIGAQAGVKAALPGARIACHEAEWEALSDSDKNLSALLGAPIVSPPPDRALHGGEQVDVGNLRLEVLHVPGHTPGGLAFYCRECGGDAFPALFAGDTLFAGSVGRGDLPGGDMGLLMQSIRERLLTLPPETRVYPGHGEPTTLEHEIRFNPFLV
jgi:glyoxylase-like metal-dependent hydrolase (beta-lactamase superfamily II)